MAAHRTVSDHLSPADSLHYFNRTVENMESDLATVCGNASRESAGGACDRKALGISLSTPILMMSTGVLGNLLALLILFTTDRQARRAPFFPLLMAMACSDLVGQAATGAIAVLVYANNLKWVGGRPLCLYHGYAMVFFAVVTPLLVCSMSVERMLALRFSYFYHRCFTHRIAKWIVMASVVFTLFFCSWPLMGFGSYELQFPGSWCFLNFHRQSPRDMAYAIVFSLLNMIIIAFIILCNITVVATLLKMRRTRHRLHSSPSVEESMGVRTRSRSALHLEMETQMVWFLLAITVVFSCLWLPINVHILMNQITGRRDYKQDLISVRLASINQIIDPWMYVIFRKKTFFKFLRRLRRFVSADKTTCTSYVASRSSNHRPSLPAPPSAPPSRRPSYPPAVCYAVRDISMPEDLLQCCDGSFQPMLSETPESLRAESDIKESRLDDQTPRVHDAGLMSAEDRLLSGGRGTSEGAKPISDFGGSTSSDAQSGPNDDTLESDRKKPDFDRMHPSSDEGGAAMSCPLTARERATVTVKENALSEEAPQLSPKSCQVPTADTDTEHATLPTQPRPMFGDTGHDAGTGLHPGNSTNLHVDTVQPRASPQFMGELGSDSLTTESCLSRPAPRCRGCEKEYHVELDPVSVDSDRCHHRTEQNSVPSAMDHNTPTTNPAPKLPSESYTVPEKLHGMNGVTKPVAGEQTDPDDSFHKYCLAGHHRNAVGSQHSATEDCQCGAPYNGSGRMGICA